ncbi:MAG: transposase [Betaproteobacteria bacterium HGW-Betaproteobacteria-5]|jgi:hypothetical protein|nr:MAG: transposase [Betaproteobacteria bacterium HGW-Betaproteobacteria-5]PKO38574.1 MAG: transposase [Betaproteobacteria bacterium HGW-Betaproteobacteria-6]
MDLRHNTALRIHSDNDAGLYRVILAEPQLDRVVLARLDPPDVASPSKGGRPRSQTTKRPRKKPQPPLIGELNWHWSLTELFALRSRGLLEIVEIEPENRTLSDADSTLFYSRKDVMRPFLDYLHFREQVLIHRGISGLVAEAMEIGNTSKGHVYKLFSLLCRFGFQESSLRPQRYKCGAPAALRPCDPDGRKKPGAKTIKQRISAAFGTSLEPAQPGMNSVWRALVMAGYSKIPTPKPPLPEVCNSILKSNFVTKYRQESGKLVEIPPEQGTYPNYRQIRRVITIEVSKLERLLQNTTQACFNRSLRGLVARNWKGVSGPGHTWAIDSTIGDVYLRSSLNRAWIVGRPIVYVMVDVWSTAIVGFYVCLTGPSWNTAKVSLFCASAPPELVADLWGYNAIATLNPSPSLPGVLMCDRGEYLSKAASQTALKLIPAMSYAPPYRPDLKGLVEVLHRIEKDRQYYFVPGAIDQRRQEYELRKINPEESVLTVKEFVAYLAIIFSEYNLTANRAHRLDAHMKADRVFPSPGGLWHWGHEMGIGVSRFTPRSELINSLLPSESARVTRQGIMLGGKEYRSDITDELQWTALARNFGTMSIPASYFPGSVSRIWTPHPQGNGNLELKITTTANASPELTFDEELDAYMFSKAGNADVDHLRTTAALEAKQQKEKIVLRAKEATQEAIERNRGFVPPITDSRALENAYGSHNACPDANPPTAEKSASDEEAEANYLSMVSAIFAAANRDEDSHE